MTIRKLFHFLPYEDALTPVFDKTTAVIPDQSLTLREMMMRFAYIGSERLEEIVNRGFDGDEDEDMLGVDVSALDYAEVHDRIGELMSKQTFARSVHSDVVAVDDEPLPDDGEADADAKAL